MANRPAPCSGAMAQVRSFDIGALKVGERRSILRHPNCGCVSLCRRVTLWHPRPALNDPQELYTVKAIARVRWGDGCGGPEVEVDFRHGVILDLSGCHDEVDIELVEKFLIPEATGPSVQQFGALSACCGAGAARGCATRTTRRYQTDAENPALIPIPPFAYAMLIAPVVPNDFFVASTQIAQLGGGIGPALITISGDQFQSNPWLLVGGAETVGIFTVETNVFEVVFLIGV